MEGTWIGTGRMQLLAAFREKWESKPDLTAASAFPDEDALDNPLQRRPVLQSMKLRIPNS